MTILIPMGRAQKAGAAFTPVIPKTWDDEAVAALDVPLADARYSPVQISSDKYYQMTVRPVYKTYPIYAPGKEPADYLEWLKQQEPEIVFDPAKLKTEADWIRAGELVFDAPKFFAPLASADVRDPKYYEETGVLLAKDGTMPFNRYVIRKKGIVEVGNGSCASCHTRVMPDGTLVKGAQGNSPTGRSLAFGSRKREARSNDQGKQELAFMRFVGTLIAGAPWIHPDPAEEFLTLDDLRAAWEAIPPGVMIREGTSLRYAPQVPDLIGVKEIRYLDHTGLVRQRSIGDLMRYSALNQDTQLLARYGDFIPAKGFPGTPSRYSDEQLYALALYVYALQPPPNPNQFDALAKRGQKVFQREGCAGCHTPPLYTSNKLTPAEGFTVPEDHPKKYDILPISVGTDSSLALRTRRGTGYYKVPSLKGVWYRGPFEHNGSVATLEDWFDPRRLREDYVPTGYKPYGVKTQAVRGHAFGLALSAEDRKALVAFLKTL